jgi:hypothetical protein
MLNLEPPYKDALESGHYVYMMMTDYLDLDLDLVTGVDDV